MRLASAGVIVDGLRVSLRAKRRIGLSCGRIGSGVPLFIARKTAGSIPSAVAHALCEV